MSTKQFKVKLSRKVHDLSLPLSIEALVLADVGYVAKTIAENMHPGYRAVDAKEIKQPKAPAAPASPRSKQESISRGSGGHGGVGGSNSSSSENLGCSGIIQGCITLVGLLIVLAIVSQCSDKGGNPSSSPTTNDIPEANVEGEAAQGSARPVSLVGMDTSPRQEPSAEQAQSIADTASQAVAAEAASGIAGARARIVDSRDRIVLQSGPKMSSKNVAKIDTGSVVQVVSDEGKWVQVRTEDGLVGYVRRTQLEKLQ